MLLHPFHHVHLVRSRDGTQYMSHASQKCLCVPILLSYLGNHTVLMLNAKVEMRQW